MNHQASTDQARPFERYLAAVAALGCVAFSVLVWLDFSPVQPMWPFPASYLIEVALVSVVSSIAFMRGGLQGRGITWAGAGILLGFSILGMFSVGALYLPTALILIAIGTSADLRNKSPIGLHLGIFLLAALTQSGLMLTVGPLLQQMLQ